MVITSKAINKATQTHIAKNIPIFTNYIFTFFTRVFLIGTLAQIYIIAHSDENLLLLYIISAFLCLLAFVSEATLYLGDVLDAIQQKIELLTRKSCRVIARSLIFLISTVIMITLGLFAYFVFVTIGEGMSMVTITQQCNR